MTERDIKLLWGRAAGRCSMAECRKQLCPYPIPNAILGRTCHIVAEAFSGPRGQHALPPAERNAYPNLILLCAEHHIIIDNDPVSWPVDRLLQVKMDHENWVKEQLRGGSLKGDVEDAIRRIDRYLTRQAWLHGLLYANIGNARFLKSLQDSDDAIWFNLNVSREFRDRYLDMLDDQFGQSPNPPFGFDWLDGLIVFQDGWDLMASQYGVVADPRPDCPTLFQDFRLVDVQGEKVLRPNQVIPVPFLPTHNGFIWGRDETTALPNDVRDDPCEDMWGAYYWVRPSGVRTVVIGVGVLDPAECANGTAIWYSTQDARPFIGAHPAIEMTPDLKRQMDEAYHSSYMDLFRKFMPATPLAYTKPEG